MIFFPQQISDRAALVEQGFDRNVDLSIPPAWTDQVEECQYALTRLNGKIQELDDLHRKNLHRPTLDDSSDDQHQIEVLTREITRVRILSPIFFFENMKRFGYIVKCFRCLIIVIS